MGRRKQKIDISRNALAALYDEAGSLDGLGEALGCSKYIARRLLDEHGIEVVRGRPVGASSSSSTAQLIPDEDRDEIAAMYDEHLTMTPIAEKYGVTRQAVSQYFARHDIETTQTKPLPSREEAVAAWYVTRSISELATELHCSRTRAVAVLDEYGLEYPSVRMTPQQVDTLVARYLAGAAPKDLAEAEGVTYQTMCKALGDAGLDLSTQKRQSAE